MASFGAMGNKMPEPTYDELADALFALVAHHSVEKVYQIATVFLADVIVNTAETRHGALATLANVYKHVKDAIEESANNGAFDDEYVAMDN